MHPENLFKSCIPGIQGDLRGNLSIFYYAINQKRKHYNQHCSLLVYQDATDTKGVYLYQEYCVGVLIHKGGGGNAAKTKLK